LLRENPVGIIFKEQAVAEESSLTFKDRTDIYFPKHQYENTIVRYVKTAEDRRSYSPLGGSQNARTFTIYLQVQFSYACCHNQAELLMLFTFE
jgi:hypothetical protein